MIEDSMTANKKQFKGNYQTESVPEKIVDRILDLIRRKELSPGDRLPPERELAQVMNVSRASIREAMRSLSLMNIVDMRHGSGTYVSSLNPDLLVERLEMVFLLNDASFLDLIQARKIIEPGLAALAAEIATQEDISALEDIIKRSYECLETDPWSFPHLDIEFHLKVAEIAQNSTLSRFMQAITRLSTASSTRTTDNAESVRLAIGSHNAIVDEIKAHESELSRLMMLKHLTQVENKIRLFVESADQTDTD